MSSTPDDADGTRSPEDPSRRTLFTRAAHVAGASLTAALAIGPLGVVLDPLLRDSKANDEPEGWSTVGAAERFTVGETPRRVILKEDVQDAWLKRAGVPVGSVLVQRTAADAFKVLSAVCPHLGCSVAYQEAKKGFLCPCHNSRFDVAGERVEPSDGSSNPAPRGLDPLEWRLQDGQLQVRWVRYKTGVADRVGLS